jgi:hypothetical protein
VPTIYRYFQSFVLRANSIAALAICDSSSKSYAVRGCESWERPMTSSFSWIPRPVPVLGYKRSKQRSDFRQSAGYGYCSARHFHYFGYKLVAATTFAGLPVLYELVAANTDERAAAEEVLAQLSGCDVFGDKGFIGVEWQQEVKAQTGNRVWTAKRVNQKEQNPRWFDRLLNSVRERIEGSFNELQNTGRNLERLLAKTVVGLSTRVIAKVTSYTLKLLLRNSFALDVQTFQVAEA